jgi:DNA-binding beta-propeller fold protein YncE
MARVSRTIALVASICGLTGLGGIALRAAFANASVRHSLRVGAAPSAPAGSQVQGSLPGNTRIQVTVGLNSQDPAGLAAYATEVATPGSTVYHQYLTVAQFTARFGATPAQVQAVTSSLRADGLHPGPVAPDDLSIPVTATAAQLSTAFATGFQSVQLQGGRKAYRNTSAPLVPASIAGVVSGVVGLDNLTLAQPMGLPAPVKARPVAGGLQPNAAVSPNVGAGPQPCSGSTGITQYATTGNGPHTDDQIAAGYGFGNLYTTDQASGQTVALYELEGFSATDITAFQNCYGTTASVSIHKCGSCTLPTQNAGSSEAALDIENVIGLAPRANVYVYEGTNGSADQYNTYAQIVNDNVAKVISTSWGLCESNATGAFSNRTTVNMENTLFQQAATQGQSIFAASGDHGSKDCGGTGSLAVDDPASQPFVTGVGATDMTSIGPPPTETVWNDYNGSNGGANEDSGGGISALWTMPSYQSGAKASLGVTTSGSGTPCGAATGSDCREVPDVVADGGVSTGYLIYWSGPGGTGWYVSGGTSAAAPAWAAYTALVNASSGCNGTSVGFVNPSLYSLAGTAFSGTYSAFFHDITVGNNSPTNYLTAGQPYSAVPGYDMASGIGSMDGATLTAALCTKSIGTVALPSGGTLPTGVAVDRTNHVAYIAESGSNTVAQIPNTTNTVFSTAATNVSSTALPSLNFPDDLALDSSQHLYASNFCVGTKLGVCSTEASGTTTDVSQQTGASTGQTDAMGTCSYPSGDAVFTPGTGSARLFVACAGSGYVAECTPSAGGGTSCATTDATVALGGSAPRVPSGVAAIPTTTTTPSVVVADEANNTVSVVSWNGTALVASTPVSLVSGCSPANVAIGPSVTGTAAVYVACPGDGKVEVGTVTGTGTPTLGTFTAANLPTTGSSTPSPYGVAVNAAGTSLVVTDSANNDVVVYPALSGTTIGTGVVVPVGTTPDGVGMDGSNAFIANETTNNVTVVDPQASGGSTGHYVRAHARVAARRWSRRAPRAFPGSARRRGRLRPQTTPGVKQTA